MAELFKNVTEPDMMDERAKEDLIASIKLKYQQKWLSLEELWTLFHQLGVKCDAEFYKWLVAFLEGSSELESELVSEKTKQEFRNFDQDSNEFISKVRFL